MICFYQPTESQAVCVAGDFVGKHACEITAKTQLLPFCRWFERPMALALARSPTKSTKAISIQFIYSLFWAKHPRIHLLFASNPPFPLNVIRHWLRSFFFFNQSSLIGPNRTNRTWSSPIELNRTFDCARLLNFFCESAIVFYYRTPLNLIAWLRSIKFEWVRFGSIRSALKTMHALCGGMWLTILIILDVGVSDQK